MDVPDISNENWEKIITGEKQVNFTFLAVKLLLARLQMRLKKNPGLLQESKLEFRTLFVEKGHLPAAKQDLELLFGGK